MKKRKKSIMDHCCAVLLSLSPVRTSGLCCILMLQWDTEKKKKHNALLFSALKIRGKNARGEKKKRRKSDVEK